MENIVPVMTSNSQDGWVASDSSHYNNDDTYNAYKALDGNINTQWVNSAENTSDTFEVQSPILQKISGIRILSRIGFPEQSPSNFTIQTSINGTDWTTQRTLTGITWTNLEQKTFNLPSIVEAKYLKLVISVSIAGGVWMSIAGLEILSPVTQYNLSNALHGDAFAFTVETTTPDETFTLPLVDGGTFDFLCNWGDNVENFISAYNDANATHTYAVPGTYTIQCVGTLTKFAFNNGGDKAKVRKLLNVADLGFDFLKFDGCSGLTEIVRPFRALNSLTNAGSMFEACNLSLIPTGLFNKCLLINSFYYTFAENDIVSIPTGLFDNHVLATNFIATFIRNKLTSIPVDLFKNNVLATNFSFSFYGNPTIVQELNGNIFLHNNLISNISYCFYDCTGLTGNGYLNIISLCETNVPAIVKTDCFHGCTGLTGWPDSINADWR